MAASASLIFGRSDGVVADVGASLNQGVDAFVNRRDRHDFDIIPSQTAGGERAIDTEPYGEMRGIFASDPFAFDIIDGFYWTVFFARPDWSAAANRA